MEKHFLVISVVLVVFVRVNASGVTVVGVYTLSSVDALGMGDVLVLF